MAKRWYVDLWKAEADDDQYRLDRTPEERMRKARQLALQYAREPSPVVEKSSSSACAQVDLGGDEDDDLFAFDEAKSFFKKRKVPTFGRLNPSESEVAKKERAAKGWLHVLLKEPLASMAGRKLAKAKEEDRLKIVFRYAADKAPNTLVQRLGPIAFYVRWQEAEEPDGWPPTEDSLARHIETSFHEKTAKTRIGRLLQAVRFLGTFEFAKAVVHAGQSRYLSGMSTLCLQQMPKRKSAKALKLQFVCRIETAFMTVELSVTIKMMAGAILVLIYFRARISDVDCIYSFEVFESRIEMEVEKTKTSKVREKVTLMAPSVTLTRREWALEYKDWRREQGIPLEDGWPLVPSRCNGLWMKQQAETGDVNQLFAAFQIRLNPGVSSPTVHTSQHCKATFLDAAAIFGITKPDRLTLGYHKNSADNSVNTYAPSTLLGPLSQLSNMVTEFADGKFDPDRQREPVRKARMAATQSDFLQEEASTGASSESSDSEAVEGVTSEAEAEAQAEIAEACITSNEADDRWFLNTTNNRRHKGRLNNVYVTACGNAVGGNIVPLAEGQEESQVDVNLLCKTCFGRSLEKRRTVAIRMSEPAEPLLDNIMKGLN